MIETPTRRTRFADSSPLTTQIRHSRRMNHRRRQNSRWRTSDPGKKKKDPVDTANPDPEDDSLNPNKRYPSSSSSVPAGTGRQTANPPNLNLRTSTRGHRLPRSASDVPWPPVSHLQPRRSVAPAEVPLPRAAERRRPPAEGGASEEQGGQGASPLAEGGDWGSSGLLWEREALSADIFSNYLNFIN